MPSPVLLPSGYRAAGVHCGVKTDPQALDLSLFVSDRPAVSVGVFTQNRICGAPVKVSRTRVGRPSTRGVVVNSGNSNACTGPQGLADAEWMTAVLAKRIGCSPEDVLVCSTGIIGRYLPREKLAAGIPAAYDVLAESPAALESAARGMMTTDTVPKIAVRAAEIDSMPVRVTGVAKGAAMIGPNMATMLGVILTDAPLQFTDADHLLRHAVDQSFNCISVEGHTSTSDTVLLLANGACSGRPAGADLNSTWIQLTPRGLNKLQQMVDEVASELATAIIKDAEGATHLITLDVRGCRTRAEAQKIAKTVADSALVKTAVHGADPNWGRIVSAVGYAGVELRDEDVSLKINGHVLFKHGAPTPFDPAVVSGSIKNQRETHVEIELTHGAEAVRYWTADLTAEYVRLNADYTT